jgi:thiamine pyrophosphate-dependent acetolactate synthase large subunit-like protein
LRDAFLEARMTRGPVVVGIPFDLQNAAWTGQGDLPVPSASLMPKASPMPPNPDDLARALALVAGAKRVVVMAGLGAVEAGAGAACVALADRLGALLATTLPARGLFVGHPFNLNVAGGFATETARDCFAEADLVIAVGTSLSHHNADGGKLWPKAHVLQIDTEPATLAQGRIAAHDHLRADARLGVEAIVAALAPRDPGWRTDALAHRIATAPADSTEIAGVIMPSPKNRQAPAMPISARLQRNRAFSTLRCASAISARIPPSPRLSARSTKACGWPAFA